MKAVLFNFQAIVCQLAIVVNQNLFVYSYPSHLLNLFLKIKDGLRGPADHGEELSIHCDYS